MGNLALSTRRRSPLTAFASKRCKPASRRSIFRAAAILCMVLGSSLFAASAKAQTWTLVWSDEFDGPAGPFTPTSSNNQWWTFDTGHGIFGTGEIEYMIDDGSTSYLDGQGNL